MIICFLGKSTFCKLFRFFKAGKFPKNIFEKLIDGEPFVNVTPLSSRSKDKKMQVIFPIDQDKKNKSKEEEEEHHPIMMDPDRMTEVQMKDKQMKKADKQMEKEKNVNENTMTDKEMNEGMEKEKNMNEDTTKEMMDKDSESMEMKKEQRMETDAQMNEGKMNLKKDEVMTKEEKKENLENFERNLIRKIKLSDRKVESQEERNSKSVTFDDQSKISEEPQVNIDIPNF
jgi:hypothetical protein